MPEPCVKKSCLGAADFVKKNAAFGNRADVFEECLVRSAYLEIGHHHGVVQVAHEDTGRPSSASVFSLGRLA
jgi:hypothetical protein